MQFTYHYIIPCWSVCSLVAYLYFYQLNMSRQIGSLQKNSPRKVLSMSKISLQRYRNRAYTKLLSWIEVKSDKKVCWYLFVKHPMALWRLHNNNSHFRHVWFPPCIFGIYPNFPHLSSVFLIPACQFEHTPEECHLTMSEILTENRHGRL